MATVTGTYVLRPTKIRTWLSGSQTFTDYWDTSSVSTPSSWKNALSYVGDANKHLGDQSDSTYAVIDTGTTKYGANRIYGLTPDSSSSVPSVDYKITKIQTSYRSMSYGGDVDGTNRVGALWLTMWQGAAFTPAGAETAGKPVKYFSVKNFATTSLTTRTGTSTVSMDVTGGTYPDMLAVCLYGYKYTHLVSFKELLMTDVWYTITYEYEKDSSDSAPTITYPAYSILGTSMTYDSPFTLSWSYATEDTGTITYKVQTCPYAFAALEWTDVYEGTDTSAKLRLREKSYVRVVAVHEDGTTKGDTSATSVYWRTISVTPAQGGFGWVEHGEDDGVQKTGIAVFCDANHKLTGSWTARIVFPSTDDDLTMTGHISSEEASS